MSADSHSQAAHFEQLYDAHYQDLLAFAIRRVTTRADAADVVAETFTIAWQKQHELPPPAQQRPWLFGVARNVAHARNRGEHKQIAIAENLRATIVEHLAHAPPTDLALSVRNALAQLSPTDRDVITMAAWDGLTNTEIADVLGISRTAARVKLHRARSRLKKLCAPHVDHTFEVAKEPKEC